MSLPSPVEGTRPPWSIPPSTAGLAGAFARDGYLVLRRVVDRRRLASLTEELVAEFSRASAAGELFSGGGLLSGHLNCFPGTPSRFAFDALRERGVLKQVRELWPDATRLPNIGCNFNLPGSCEQNVHVDGYAARPFIVANVATVDTTLENGAMEAIPGSHLRPYKYWQLALSDLPRVRIELEAGDVLIRPSTLWHRGMPNRTRACRPMLAFTWENGGSELADPYARNAGRITFLPNRYTRDLSGNMREFAFAALPRVGSAYLFLRSLFSSSH
ncbi:MAG: phytanoyl-CoA dioxygenase family protein [Myxococcales bacterium]